MKKMFVFGLLIIGFKAKAQTVLLFPATQKHSVLVPVKETPVIKAPLGPRDYYQQQFGFFCKQEWQLEKKTRFALKLRLGSYQEAQRIEGK